MTEIPNSGKTGLPGSAMSRLRSEGRSASAHPEANLLAAFSEQVLTAPERDEVLAHLAQCTDCREIVALSLPPADESMQPAPVELRGWFGMRPEFMRWAVVGASATVVVAAVLLVRPELESPRSKSTVAVDLQQQRTNQGVLESTDTALAKKQGKPATPAEERDKGTAEGERSRRADMLVASQEAAPAEVSKNAPVMAKQAAPAPAAAAPPPPYAFGISGASGSGAIGGMAAGRGAGAGTGSTVEKRTEVEVTASAPVVATESPARASAAKPTTAAQAQAGRADTDDRALHDAAAKKENPQAAGEFAKLAKDEKKTDSGLALETADRAEETKSTRNMMVMRKASNEGARTWRVLEGKAQWSRDAGQSWATASLPAGVNVLAVDAGHPLASSVWVGGAAGVVLASNDHGATWKRISAGWSGDVVSIKFADAKNGVLRTSTKEEWFTEDGGVSWKRR